MAQKTFPTKDPRFTVKTFVVPNQIPSRPAFQCYALFAGDKQVGQSLVGDETKAQQYAERYAVWPKGQRAITWCGPDADRMNGYVGY